MSSGDFTRITPRIELFEAYVISASYKRFYMVYIVIILVAQCYAHDESFLHCFSAPKSINHIERESSVFFTRCRLEETRVSLYLQVVRYCRSPEFVVWWWFVNVVNLQAHVEMELLNGIVLTWFFLLLRAVSMCWIQLIAARNRIFPPKVFRVKHHAWNAS